MAEDALAPVEKELRVRLAPASAFDLFTREMSHWWPLATHSCAGADAQAVTFPMEEGGQVIEQAKNGSRHIWGEVLAWEPPHRFAMTWHPGSSAAQATRLEVRFSAAEDGGTIVRLRHDGWAARPDGAQARGGYAQGWESVLACYVALTTAGQG